MFAIASKALKKYTLDSVNDDYLRGIEMYSEKGSLWHKWDFHVHTPYSVLNNEFGFNPYSDKEKFDEYVVKLFTKAIDNGVSAIGITDYFSIEGYKRIRQEYLDDSEKMKYLFPNEYIRKKISNIYIFPNIEFRIDTFVGKNNHSVNYHVIFSDHVNVEDIEEDFLNRLEITDNYNCTYSLTQKNISHIGSEYKKHNSIDKKKNDYLVGLEKVTVNYKNIKDVLEKCHFKNEALISIPVNEDLSQIDWNGRDYATRKILYQQCDLLMTSCSKTRQWALAIGNESERIAEFRSIKPCIWGSDAHSYEKLFCPDDNRFCWIKSDLCFEGLLQILYEPADRVRIQKEKPEEKDSHSVIDYVVFYDDKVQSNPIYFSDGLTAIIGGKSTGKSTLLRHVAKSIDITQVQNRESKLGFIPSLNLSSKVFWRDGSSGSRRIIYIPQSWLNRIVDEREGESQLNLMIKDVVLQQDEISKADSIRLNKIDEINQRVKHLIIDYVSLKKQIESDSNYLLSYGASFIFKKSIEFYEQKRSELSSSAGLTEQDLSEYTKLETNISELKKYLNEIEKENSLIEKISSPFLYLPLLTTVYTNGTHDYHFESLELTHEKLDVAVKDINELISHSFNLQKDEINSYLKSLKNSCLDALNKFESQISPMRERVFNNDLLMNLDKQILSERDKYSCSLALENKINENKEKLENVKQQIVSTHNEIKNVYNDFINVVNKVKFVNSDITLEIEPVYKKQELFDSINGLFTVKSLKALNDKFNLVDFDNFKISEELFNELFIAIEKGALIFKGGNDIQSSLERIFEDWCYVHYSVKTDNDSFNNMSPGKRALVLLELIINLENSKCPILIDQPEDDLDNRSIYTDLVSYLKLKKRDRQIIVVTHNANVVIGADAEEVIIANQNSFIGNSNDRRFEYRSGSIENNSPVYEKDGNIKKGVLYEKGIQEQICDILEGGKDAFELRRRKYISNLIE